MRTGWTRRRRPRRRLRATTRPLCGSRPTAWAKLLFLRDCGPTEVGGFGISAAERPAAGGGVRAAPAALHGGQRRSSTMPRWRTTSTSRSTGVCRPSGSPGSGSIPIRATRPSRVRSMSRRSSWSFLEPRLGGDGDPGPRRGDLRRLRFNTGPGGRPPARTAVDYRRPFAGGGPGRVAGRVRPLRHRRAAHGRSQRRRWSRSCAALTPSNSWPRRSRPKRGVTL